MSPEHLIVCENCNSPKAAGEDGWIEVAGAGEYYCPECHAAVSEEDGG